ncbi:hypothetical protein E2C01_089731 [Portunus trituberculatus]|uniref:Uncharacterized protein n=1 Tax=Portunus trituberculatus TaxID=210409 RepID=A0A5B7JN87_PORTR|nr:hypothetical protein [Portunus trituberculatus]
MLSSYDERAKCFRIRATETDTDRFEPSEDRGAGTAKIMAARATRARDTKRAEEEPIVAAVHCSETCSV